MIGDGLGLLTADERERHESREIRVSAIRN